MGMKGKSHSLETRKKISKTLKKRFTKYPSPMTGKKHSLETKNRMSEARRLWCAENKESFLGENNPMWGKTFKHTKKAKKKISEATRKMYDLNPNMMKGENHPNWGKPLSEINRKRIGEANKGKKRTKKMKKEMSKRSRERLKDENYLKLLLSGLGRRPNNIEKIIDEMTPDFIRYTGDGSWWRRLHNGKYKNPDFKVTGQNKIIEIWGDYWHKKENPNFLIEHYRRSGLECLVIWENEIYSDLQEIANKIYQFI